MNPLDSAMPFLERALDRAEAEAALARLPNFSQMGVRLEAVRLIRHKLGRRAAIEYTLRVTPPGGGSDLRVLIGKARAKGPDQKSFALTEKLSLEFEQVPPPSISIPRPYAVLPEFNLWLQEKVPGEPVTHFLPGESATAVCARVAEAAHKVHRSAVTPRRTHTVTDEIKILNERLMAVANSVPAWTARLEKLREQCHELALTLPSHVPRPIHRDFHPGQILVDRDRTWLLDFDLFSLGDPAVDVGNFIAHITEMSLRQTGDASAWRALEGAVEDAYVSLAQEAARSRIRVYALLTLARHIYISTQFPERQAFTERLLSLCEQRMANAG